MVHIDENYNINKICALLYVLIFDNKNIIKCVVYRAKR